MAFASALDHTAIRRIAITAVFSDDCLFERVVLKGGSALSIALGLSGRTSMDLDFSIENDFENPDDARNCYKASTCTLNACLLAPKKCRGAHRFRSCDLWHQG